MPSSLSFSVQIVRLLTAKVIHPEYTLLLHVAILALTLPSTFFWNVRICLGQDYPIAKIQYQLSALVSPSTSPAHKHVITPIYPDWLPCPHTEIQLSVRLRSMASSRHHLLHTFWPDRACAYRTVGIQAPMVGIRTSRSPPVRL